MTLMLERPEVPQGAGLTLEDLLRELVSRGASDLHLGVGSPPALRVDGELTLLAVVAELARRPRGLVLVTGPTGSGKSTTLAAMIDPINRTRSHHIVTIEDPIEFLHRNKKCVVRQREVTSPDRALSRLLVSFCESSDRRELVSMRSRFDIGLW